MLVVLPIRMNAAAKDYYMCMRLGRGPIDNTQVQYRAQSGQEFTIYTVNWRSPLGLTACSFVMHTQRERVFLVRLACHVMKILNLTNTKMIQSSSSCVIVWQVVSFVSPFARLAYARSPLQKSP